MGQDPAQPRSDAPPTPTAGPARDDRAVQPAMPAGPPAGTGILRTPGVPPQQVPLMSIRKDEPADARVQVGPITPGVGVPDVLLGSIGIVAVAVIGSLILGAILGGVLVLLKHRLGWGGPDRDAEDHITLTER